MTNTAILEPLNHQIHHLMQTLRVPGVALGLILDGQAYTAGYGVTSIENPLPVTAETLFQIGSTTKTFNGTSIMRLIENEVHPAHLPPLELDRPVRDYLPDFRLSDPSAAATVTMRHLMTHTSGWVGDYFEDYGPGADALAQYVSHMRDLPQLTPPGEVWSYNNANFWVMGRMIEVLTGQTWEAALKEWVIDPLGLTRSFFFADDVIAYRFAVGHHVRKHSTVVARRWSFPRRRPSGALISTVTDQLRYARFHMGDGANAQGKPLLTTASLRLMQTPQCARSLDGTQMGLTWMLPEIAGTRIVQHGGATNGQMSAFVMVPSRNFALTILTNADKGAVLHRAVTRWALEHYLGLREPQPAIQSLPPDQLMPYTGRYQTPPCELNIALPDIELTIRDGGLFMEFHARGGYPTRDSPQPPPAPLRLAFCGVDQVIALDETAEDLRGDFLRDSAGRIAFFRWGSRIRPRVP